MQKVAIIMLGIHELTGGSGSERFFADVFEAYCPTGTGFRGAFHRW